MEAKLGKVIESITNFFTGADQIPWCDRDIVAGCEQEVREAEKGSSDEFKNECIMRLSWALVHSRQTEDVQRGIAMLDSSLGSTTSPLKLREKLYLLAVGYYRSGDYSRSRELVEDCLKIEPEWRQAQSLKKAIEDRIKKDGMIGIGIATAAVGVVAGGIAAALAQLALTYSASSSIVAITGHFARVMSAPSALEISGACCHLIQRSMKAVSVLAIGNLSMSSMPTGNGYPKSAIGESVDLIEGLLAPRIFLQIVFTCLADLVSNSFRLPDRSRDHEVWNFPLRLRVLCPDDDDEHFSKHHSTLRNQGQAVSIFLHQGDELGDKAQDYQEPGSNPKHVPPQPPSEDGLV
ncbi:hypothetical protein DKX38_013908 [Salix brachista]|uniref:Mitochondrial fission 1 protein n=1 Tax=Salix brachista TaxID=2182728 RepID=A0A5N5LDU2_9ROSI|nr:hypothetical protein DKX38_013908 [Salix brachista]